MIKFLTYEKTKVLFTKLKYLFSFHISLLYATTTTSTTVKS